MSADHQNDWAMREDGSRIHIDDVTETETGRKGYYCPGIGCNAPMQAIKPKYKRPYFRHDAYNIDHNRTCTYSNETYRHKVAKEILQRIKQVKAPALYKYPPPGEEGPPNKIKGSEIIQAHRVEIGLSFFEDDSGHIKWGRNQPGLEKNLLITPDVTFFNKAGQPILFIELVATHKIDPERSARLIRLGINTIQIKIPRGNEVEIEIALKRSGRAKWAYHKEENESEYIRVPRGDSHELHEVDVEQRKLFEETFKCRKADIANLVRSINRCLESEHYQEIEQRLRSEISRTEDNARRVTGKLQKLRFTIRAGIEGSVRDQREHIENGQKSVDEQRTDLEARYNRKRTTLRQEEREVDSETIRVERELRGLGNGPGTLEGRRREIEDRRREIEEIERDESFGREEVENRIAELEGDFAEQENRLNDEITRLKREERERFEHSKVQEENRITEIKRETDSIQSETGGDTSGIEAEESELLERIVRLIERRDINRVLPLPHRYKELLDARRVLNDFEEQVSSLKRIISATECLDSKAYKAWYRR